IFDVVFLVVGLPSIISARLGFQDLVFGVLTFMLSFIDRGWLHSLLISFRLPFPLYSRISLQLSSHLWWLSLSPCLPLEVWIMFPFVLVSDFLVVVFHSLFLKLFSFHVSLDLVFGILTSMLSFIARGQPYSLLISFRLPFSLYSRISLQLSSHLWWLSLSPCLPLEVLIMFPFVYVMWAW
ncbi:hypothetical protein HID58_044076, partial [Brassica napus]